MSLAYFIYYRVAEPAPALILVRDIQTALKAAIGVEGRLLSKRNEPATWMEVYEGVTDFEAFERCLANAVRAVDFASVLSPGSIRHVECFAEPCA